MAVFTPYLGNFGLDEAFEVGEWLLGVYKNGDWFNVCFVSYGLRLVYRGLLLTSMVRVVINRCQRHQELEQSRWCCQQFTYSH